MTDEDLAAIAQHEAELRSKLSGCAGILDRRFGRNLADLPESVLEPLLRACEDECSPDPKDPNYCFARKLRAWRAERAIFNAGTVPGGYKDSNRTSGSRG